VRAFFFWGRRRAVRGRGLSRCVLWLAKATLRVEGVHVDPMSVTRPNPQANPRPRTPATGTIALLACVLLWSAPSSLLGSQDTGAWWNALGVRDLSGRTISGSATWYVVAFLGQECPVSNVDIPVLNTLAGRFGPMGFLFVGAYVDPYVDADALREHARAYRLGFMAADDRRQALVKLAGAAYTPEVAVFDRTGRLLYVGRIDDHFSDNGAARPAAATQDLRDVLELLASGKPGPFPGRQGFGCSIPEMPAK